MTKLDHMQDIVPQAIAWLDEMIADEAKAATDYTAFADFLEPAGADPQMDVETGIEFKQLLRDTALHVRAIARDEQKHHDVFQAMRAEFERFK